MRFALIGSNFIVDWFMEAAVLCDRFELQTVYSRSEEQAKTNQEKWRAATWDTDLERVARDPLVDAVYIASPNACHPEQTRAFLKAGKHVLCEKPIAPSAAEFEALLRLANERGLLLLEAMRPAFLPALETIRSLLPELGTLRHAEFPYCQYSSRYDRYREGFAENTFDPTLCNGALMDIGVYCIHWMVLLLGAPRSVCSRATFLDHSIDVTGAAVCDYPTLQASVSYSKVHKGRRPCVIEGEKASLSFAPFPLPETITVTALNGDTRMIEVDTRVPDMVHEINTFIMLTKNPADALPYQQHSISTLKVMDRIREDNGIDFRRRHRANG